LSILATAFRRAVCPSLVLALAACGGGSGGSGAVTPASNALSSQVAPLSVAAPLTNSVSTLSTTMSTTTGTTVWKAGDPVLGKWVTSNTYQCGTPQNSGTTFTFNLVKNGTSCGRDQASPTDSSGSLSRLTDGKTYTWSFHYIDGTPSGSGPGMGYDVDARSLIWQIHPYSGGNPCSSLNFDNGGVVGAPQKWYISNCSGIAWRGSYTPGEQDDWKIVVLISQTSSGRIQLYRNGSLVANVTGPTYTNSGGGSGNPWWNFGPYKWRWELAGGGGSDLSQVNATIENMVVTQQ
jgi:hypothetical protein